MINAKKARNVVQDKRRDARNSEAFKHAIAKLEERIKSAIDHGETEISYNNCFFEYAIPGQYQKAYPTQAELDAIKEYMEDNGYRFYFHSVMNIGGYYNSCFTCRW